METVMIHTGLSVRVAGCIIKVERPEGDDVKVARIVVDSGGQTSLKAVEYEAVKFQAGLLKARAERFFGIEWVVHAWDGKVAVEASQRAG